MHRGSRCGCDVVWPGDSEDPDAIGPFARLVDVVLEAFLAAPLLEGRCRLLEVLCKPTALSPLLSSEVLRENFFGTTVCLILLTSDATDRLPPRYRR